MGVIYTQEGDQARAALASAERSVLEAQYGAAMRNADMAMKGLPPGSADYLRAQDIAMTSKTEWDKDKKNRKRGS